MILADVVNLTAFAAANPKRHCLASSLLKGFQGSSLFLAFQYQAKGEALSYASVLVGKTYLNGSSFARQNGRKRVSAFSQHVRRVSPRVIRTKA